MRRTTIQRTGLLLGTVISAISLSVIPAGALASAKAAKTAAASTNSNVTAAQQARIQRIISRGNNEITRRLSTLNTLSTKINGAAKLSAADKASLSSEVTTEISGLTSLKAKLNADTTLSDAQTDAQSIINDYRVYALIVPKVNLIKTADDQQVAEGRLSDLSSKLQTRLSAEQAAGKNVTSLQSGLTSMESQITAAEAISTQIESSVINLQPTDYDSNHSVLSGDNKQLKTAQTDIQTAITTGSTIISGLKNL